MALSIESPWMNEELRTFRKTVRRFVHEEFVPHQERWRKQHRPDAEAWSSAGAAGLLLTDIPEQYGGGGGTLAHEAVIAEELAQAGVHFASLNQSIVAHYILAYGSEEQKQSWLPRLAAGELVGAISITEAGAGSDLQAIKTTSIRCGDDYMIKGAKTFVTNGLHASLVVLAVKTDPNAAGPRSISLLAIEPKSLAGYSVGVPLEKLGMNTQDTCELFFDGVRVPASSLLGPTEGKGLSQMMAQLPYERLMIAAASVATAEQALAITTKYAKQRKAFGGTLLELQHVRFKLAECRTESRIGRVFLDHCIQEFIAGRLDAATAAMAKYWLTECEGRILDACVQMHGGYGYMADYPIARMWTDSRVRRIYGGANEVMKELIGWSL